jgi:flagellar export protein FliJ
MTRFQFRLDRILQLREAAEKQQAIVLNEAAKAEDEQRRRSEESAERVSEITDQIHGPNGINGVAAGLWQVYGMSLGAARDQASSESAKLADAEQKRNDELERFSEARVARRALERLKEVRAGDWAIAAGQQEQLDIDEVARRMGSGPGSDT